MLCLAIETGNHEKTADMEHPMDQQPHHSHLRFLLLSKTLKRRRLTLYVSKSSVAEGNAL